MRAWDGICMAGADEPNAVRLIQFLRVNGSDLAHAEQGQVWISGLPRPPLPMTATEVLRILRAAQSQILATRRRSALPITDTELKLMAAAAIMGLKRIPKVG